MNPVWHLGNDVVDLTDPRCRQRSSDARFLARVFAPEEVEAIHLAPDPDRALWIRWAGKEAAFKSMSKLLGSPPPFHHPLFRVEIPADGRSLAMLEGSARYGERALALRVGAGQDSVHALTWVSSSGAAHPDLVHGLAAAPEWSADWRTTLRARFSPREWRCVSHEGSAVTRLAARRALAASLAVEEDRIEITCGPGSPGRRIPIVLLDGGETSVDLSLSHHGRLSAWVFSVRTPEGG
jgi:hypothetical protein